MLKIRPITAGELAAFSVFAACEDRGFAPADPVEFEKWLANLWTTGRSRPAYCFVAERGGQFKGAVVFWKNENRFHLEHYRPPEESPSDGVELLRGSRELLYAQGAAGIWAEVVSPPLREPALSNLLMALDTIDLKRVRYRLRFRRELAAQPAFESDLIFKSLAEVGQEVFIAAWAASAAESLDGAISKDREADGVLAHATKSFSEASGLPHDPDQWEIAFDSRGQQVGVIVPGFIEGEPVIHYYGVLPDHRGKGAGRALLMRGVQALASGGASPVRLDVDGANTPSVRAILSAGFKEIRSYSWYEHAIQI